MGLNNQIWQIACIEYKIGAAAAQTIGAMTASAINTNLEVDRPVTAQNVYPTAATVAAVDPTATFTTLSVKEAIRDLGFFNLCLTPGTDQLAIYAQKRVCEGPAVNTLAVHNKYNLRGGILAARTLRVDHRQNAEYSSEIFMVTDDSAQSPIVLQTNQQMPDLPAVDNVRWTMGPGTQLGGVACDGKLSIELDFGVTVEQFSSDSELFNTYAGIATILPRLIITGYDLEWFNTLGDMLTGKQLAHADSWITLQKRGVAATSPEHMRITLNGLGYVPGPFDGNSGEPAQIRFEMDATEDASGRAPFILYEDVTLP